jgi:hypothetical protein
MTENDIRLIKQSFETDDWSDVSVLEKQAETTECQLILNDRKVHLYRREEQFANQL